MKCKQCGADLTSDHVYCEVCGAEYQIVPDFEPELESSIARTLSDLSESIQSDSKVKPEAEKHPVSRFQWGGLLLAILLFAGLFLLYYNSVSAILGRAGKAEERGDYLEAAAVYAKLTQKQPQEEEWHLKEAAMYLQAGEKEEALERLLYLVSSGSESTQVYDMVLSLYLEKGRYQEMHDLLSAFDNEQLREAYGAYYASLPDSSHDSGSYDAKLEIALRGVEGGRIYYTLDGTVPGKESTLYEGPFTLGNGTHRLQAVLINPYGISSEVLVRDFEVNTPVPLAPVAEPEDGEFDSACFIEVTAEDGTRIYYTADGSLPTEKSTLYEGPIPMPLGESVFSFVACSEAGELSEVAVRNYLLNIKTGITVEEAENLLVQTLIEKGLLLDKNGALLDRYGVHRYFYEYPLLIEGNHYYIFEEHYLENEINRKTGVSYAVDVKEGDCFHLGTTDFGEYFITKMNE